MRRAYGPPRDLGPGDLGVRELAAREREEDDEDENKKRGPIHYEEIYGPDEED